MKTEFVTISDELFLQLGKLITERYGIKMNPEKKIMFQSRLQRRLRELNIGSFDEYAERLIHENADSNEFALLADYISTNKTEFFREKEHFNFLTDYVLPEMLTDYGSKSLPMLRLWSAGSSDGQEAYSMAISIEEFRRQQGIPLNYSVLATDISGRMLKAASMAIYSASQVTEIPLETKHRYFLKSKDNTNKKVKVVREIRDHVKVAYFNLMNASYVFDYQFDIVFLRNTLIYFEQQTQRSVLTKVLDNIRPGGFLFIGHAESLINMNLPIEPVSPSVYMKKDTQNQ